MRIEKSSAIELIANPGISHSIIFHIFPSRHCQLPSHPRPSPIQPTNAAARTWIFKHLPTRVVGKCLGFQTFADQGGRQMFGTSNICRPGWSANVWDFKHLPTRMVGKCLKSPRAHPVPTHHHPSQPRTKPISTQQHGLQPQLSNHSAAHASQLIDRFASFQGQLKQWQGKASKPNNKQASKQWQASRQASKHASKQARTQASKQAKKQASTQASKHVVKQWQARQDKTIM